MNPPTKDCDHRRIDDFLDSNRVGLEDEQLLEHLNTCTACREYMETRAADSDSWTTAASLLQPGEFDHASSEEYSLATIGSARVDPPAAIQSVLDLLSPSEEPSRLGRLGTYEVSGVIGAGGMGVVLKAVDPALDRVVAIKVLAPHLAHSGTARRRFSREAKAAAAVLHPNVIPIHSVSSDERVPYLVMAYIRGGSLQKRLDHGGPLSTVEVLRIGSQVAAGLAAAHEQGLVHRDVKPENILLEEGVERITLTDFGLARAVDDASVTQPGTIAGTPQYMSPEQTRGEPIDQQSDLFSLGCVLYALCTGCPPFRADSSYAVMRKISDDSPMPIRELNPEIPEWLCAIIDKLMAKKKTDRFKSAREVHELLEACLGHAQQPTVTKLPEIPRVRPSNNQSQAIRILIGVLAMSAVVACVLFGMIFFGNMPQDQTNKQNNQPVAAHEYKPTATTQKLLADLDKQIKSKESPWGDSIAAKQSFWNGELREALTELIRDRLETLQAGKAKDARQTVNELRGLTRRLQAIAQPNESSYGAAGKLAAMSWPLLLSGYPEDLNEAMVELTVVYPAIRVNDRTAEGGRPTEPLGWDVQSAHAIALARAGKIAEARNENVALRKKIAVNLEKGRLPDLQLEFLGKMRSQRSLLKQVQLQESLILAIAGKTAESVHAAAAAGQVEVEKATEDDQVAIEKLLRALTKAMPTGKPG